MREALAAAALRRTRARIAACTAEAGPDLRTLRAQLARTGLPPRTWHGVPAEPPQCLVQACAWVDAAARAALGLIPHDGQWLGALAMLDGRLAELATGEGKTLAMALAAAVGALAGEPVHLITANDYLVARDAQRMAPLYARLGLTVAPVLPGQADPERRAAWAADIAVTTARELVFDHLRDGLAAAPQAGTLAAHAHRLSAGAPGHAGTPRLARGLRLALIDEADSVLLDEATLPLILAEPVHDAAAQARRWRALRLARGLQAHRHFQLGERAAELCLTDDGRTALAAATAPDHPTAPAAWPSARERDDAVCRALVALHHCRRDHDYLVADGQVQLIDSVTGRRAEGRQWSQGLHALVALKEGLVPPAEQRTAAQTSYQRFFPGYARLGGMSGTLIEARAELARVYGLAVLRVPPQHPPQRRTEPTRAFATPAARWAAVAQRCAELQAQGRPVLVGTDSVADSQALAAVLRAAGLAPAVLNARQDADEAAIVAAAGEPGRITVATRMAGRGTDIVPTPAALAAGGLHVLSCQRNPSPRLDRQLAGRAARQGQPGSHAHWLLWPVPEPAAPAEGLGGHPLPASRLRAWLAPDHRWSVPAAGLAWLARRAGRSAESRERAGRIALLTDERERLSRLHFARPGV